MSKRAKETRTSSRTLPRMASHFRAFLAFDGLVDSGFWSLVSDVFTFFSLKIQKGLRLHLDLNSEYRKYADDRKSRPDENRLKRHGNKRKETGRLLARWAAKQIDFCRGYIHCN